MKLQELFEEIKYGKETFESSKSTDEILECYDSDYKKFFISKRLTNLCEGVTQNSSATELIHKFIKMFEEVEQKEISNSIVFPVFYKMRLGNLTESYNSLLRKFNDVKFTKEIDRTKFSKLVGTLQYGIEYISEKACSTYYISDTPTLLQENVEHELALLESIIE